MPRSKPGRYGATQRFSQQHDAAGVGLADPGEVLPRRLRVPVGSLFARAAAALAIAPVVENERRVAQPVKHQQVLHAVGNVAGVAVQQQHRAAGLARRDEPAVQSHPVIGGEPDFLEFEPRVARSDRQLLPDLRKIHQAGLEQKHPDQQSPIGGGQHCDDIPDHAHFRKPLTKSRVAAASSSLTGLARAWHVQLLVQPDRLLSPAQPQVEHFHRHRERHGEVDVALRNIHLEAFANERDAH